MVSVVACLLLGLVLAVAAGLKLAGGAAARTALATYGLVGRAAWAAWAGLIAAELALGAAVGAGLGWAARAAALLVAAGALAQLAALAAGRAGAPCGCFGARGRVGNGSVGRAVLLAAALALVPVLPRREPSTDGWLTIGLVLALAGLVALAVVVLALAREVGMLRLAVPQAGALEVAHEGPEIGARLTSVFDAPLAPAIARFGDHPSVVLRTFDEVADAGAWAAADVPGSPFAVALDADGTVLAKGTFNTGAQLESVLAAAERRRGAVRA
jgi:hypothetical protein